VVDSERVSRLLDAVRADLAFLRTLAGQPLNEIALAAVKYRFVTAIEGCTKVAHHLVSSEGWAVPESNAAAVRELAEHGVVKRPVAESVARAVGFRNVLVHQYAEVDDAVVIGQLTRLDDLDAYVGQVATWLITAED
jgi:uncharacterized protein YutE (UPF0331/DUF86 family)